MFCRLFQHFGIFHNRRDRTFDQRLQIGHVRNLLNIGPHRLPKLRPHVAIQFGQLAAHFVIVEPMKVPDIEAAQLGGVEARRGAADFREIEFALEFF